MPKIFISYKRQDKDIVFPVVDLIKQKTGVDCWIDMEGIESGDQFQNVIIDAIDNADIVVFMLSKNFIAPYRDEITGEIDLKKQTFPEKEVMYALRHNKRLIPISIDGTTVYDCKWLEFNCSGLDCISWGVEEQKSKLLNNLRQWSGNKPTTNAILNTYHSSGTFAVESHPGYACLHINVEETCKIYRFGKQIGEIKGGDWGELYLRMGKHELSFVSEKSLTVTKVIEIPSVDFTDFIHIEFTQNNIDKKDGNKSSSSTDKKQGMSFSINALRKNKGCSIALTVVFVLCIVVLPLGYLSFDDKKIRKIIVSNTTKEREPIASKRTDRYEGGVTATPPIDNIEFIDLGLPSKNLWADRNVGAKSVIDKGTYSSFLQYDGSIFPCINCHGRGMLEKVVCNYCSGTGYLTNLKVPSIEDFEELISCCKWNWIEKDGISGYEVIGPSEKSIFLPEAIIECSDNERMKVIYTERHWSAYWSNSYYQSLEFMPNKTPRLDKANPSTERVIRCIQNGQ